MALAENQFKTSKAEGLVYLNSKPFEKLSLQEARANAYAAIIQI